jgi:outer membrane protein insertion porin family
MQRLRWTGLSACVLTLAVAPAWAQPSTPPASTPPAQTTPAQPAPGAASPAPTTPAPAPAAPAAGAPAPVAPASGTPTSTQTPAAQAPARPAAQAATGPIVCGTQMSVAKQPPAGSPPIVLAIAPCFEKQGGVSVVEANTYLYYIQTQPSRPSQDSWKPYDDKVEQTIRDDFRRLWNTNFLDDLSIDVRDYAFANGTVGKIVVYNMEERQRVKIVDYVGSKQVESTKIDEKLREENINVRLDSFIDPGVVRRVKGVVQGMLSEKGFLDSEITPEIKPIGGQQKMVHLTFNIKEGPKYKIRHIEFVGNKAVGDGTLRRRMKEIKEQWMFSFITGRGTYKQTKYEEDAEKVQAYYRDKGYITTQVGNPEVKTLETTKDNETRFIELRIPVIEGPRYKVGKFDFSENKVVKSEALRSLFKVKEGDYYSEKIVRKGLEKAREVYGGGGYWEFTGYPMFKRLDEADPNATAEEAAAAAKKPAIVDVTMHMQEGEQYFVNRITFVGNHTTRDNVIRREMRLVENGIFNTEALKFSVKRLNQLGYFKQLEGEKAIKVEKTTGQKNLVDVTLSLEEQNRNQLQFGAGYSQFEGTFLQFSFSTSNFMGRGETLSTSVLTGARYNNYQVSFTEPFMFDRAISTGATVFRQNIKYIGQFTQQSNGGTLSLGVPISGFSRMFFQYTLQSTRIKDLDPLFIDQETGKVDLAVLGANPYLKDALLIDDQGNLLGSRIISKITPSYVYNTVDNPIFPTSGRRLTASFDFAGLGGNTKFIKPSLEGIFYFQQTKRTSIGLRGQFEYIKGIMNTQTLPIYERLILGGEYSIRGYDIRSIGPIAQGLQYPLVIGGNKSLLFNAEYLIQVAGPVRLVLFYDTGQVRNDGEQFRSSAFVSSTGAEVRFFMPVLNVPFRLIFAKNINYDGIYTNNYEPEKKFRFRFAVGSTF